MRWPGGALSRYTALHLEVVRASEKYHIFEESACRSHPSNVTSPNVVWEGHVGEDIVLGMIHEIWRVSALLA